MNVSFKEMSDGKSIRYLVYDEYEIPIGTAYLYGDDLIVDLEDYTSLCICGTDHDLEELLCKASSEIKSHYEPLINSARDILAKAASYG